MIAILLALGLIVLCGVFVTSPFFGRFCLEIFSYFKGPLQPTCEPCPCRPKVKTSSNQNESFDFIVVGAGCAGCTLALRVAEMGYNVFLVDKDFEGRSNEPQIIGELMQPGGIDVLRKFGIAECALEADGAPSYGYSILNPLRDRSGSLERTNTFDALLLHYAKARPNTILQQAGVGLIPREFTETELKNLLPPPNSEKEADKVIGWGFHYFKFVRNLRAKCSNNPRITCKHATVTDLIEDKRGRVIGINCDGDDGSPETHDIRGALTVICDAGGNPRWRRQMGIKGPPRLLSTWVGMGLKHKEWETPCVFPAHGNIVLTDPSPIIFYQNSPGETRLLMCIDDCSDTICYASEDQRQLSSCYDKDGNFSVHTYIESVLVPQMPECLSKAVLDELARGAGEGPNRALIYKNCYCVTIPQQWTKQGVMCVGDSFSMRHAITGGGMMVTLKDVDLLASAIQDEDILASDASLKLMTNVAKKRQHPCGTLNILANCIHMVLSTPPGKQRPYRQQLKAAIYIYLMQGNIENISGTMGLISGLSPNNGLLVFHFFGVVRVALVEVFKKRSKSSFWNRLIECHAILHTAIRILMPHVKRENATILATWPFRKVIDFLFPWGEATC